MSDKIRVNRFQKIYFMRTGAAADERAFERALRFCERSGAELRIITTYEDPPTGILRLLASWGVESEFAQQDSQNAAEQERLLEMARNRGVQVSAESLHGAGMRQIVQKIQAEECDLVIKAADPMEGFSKIWFGGVDRHLFRNCPCPVWIDRGTQDGATKRILAAVDPSPMREEIDLDPVNEALNRKILEMAILLAELEEAELHVIHVWRSYFEGSLQSRAGMSDEESVEVSESFRRLHEDALAELLQPFRSQISQIYLQKGYAAEEICGLVEKKEYDAVVMGTVCRTGVAGWVFGNTAEAVLQQVQSSVVALKPLGWVSPVAAE